MSLSVSTTHIIHGSTSTTLAASGAAVTMQLLHSPQWLVYVPVVVGVCSLILQGIYTYFAIKKK